MAITKFTVFFQILKKIVLGFFILSIGSTVLFRFIPIPITPLMLQRCIEQSFTSDRKVRLKKDWQSLEHISKNIQLAVVCSEDQKFLDHFGFDVDAIKKAVDNNSKKGKKVKGASTISQQTAKNVFLLPTRSWIRKGFEVYFTFLIELLWSKERIIEVYLNIIEFGDGIYGAEAAAQYYFKKTADKLSASEAAIMAGVLPNPLKFKLDKPSGYMKKRQRWILRQMSHWGYEIDFDKKELEKDTEEPEDEGH
jgi:monofunctional biosynthetic peptidoglycan transglycosylase